MTCIYHSRDLDGFCSAAIVLKKYPDCQMIGYDYGQAFPEIPMGEELIMVDVSLPMDRMVELGHRCSRFTWIDHHISAIREYEALPQWDQAIIRSVLDSTKAACEGTWTYLFPEDLMPEAVLLLGEYDSWRNQNQERGGQVVLPFQYGMRQMCNGVTSFPMVMLEPEVEFNPMLGQAIGRGRTILTYQRQQDEAACKSAAFEFTFEGYRAICLNGGGFNSNAFASVYDEAKHDIMMPFRYNGKFWTFSLYTTKDIDCSEISKKYGGGGHKKAAGFQVEDFNSVFKKK